MILESARKILREATACFVVVNLLAHRTEDGIKLIQLCKKSCGQSKIYIFGNQLDACDYREDPISLKRQGEAIASFAKVNVNHVRLISGRHGYLASKFKSALKLYMHGPHEGRSRPLINFSPPLSEMAEVDICLHKQRAFCCHSNLSTFCQK